MLQHAAKRRSDIRLGAEPLNVHVVADEDGFEALRPEWNALVDRMDPPSPFNAWEWAWAWWRHLRPDAATGGRCELRIVSIREGERLVGLAPFYRRRIGRGGVSATVLLPIGWEAGRGWSVTEQLELLLPGESRTVLLAALAEWLRRTPFSAALLPGLHENDRIPARLQRYAVASGAPIPYLHRDLGSSWDGFVAGLNKSLRDNVKYYPRLLRRSGHQVRFAVAQSPSEVNAVLPLLFELHRARAEASRMVMHRDQFASPARRAFFRSVAPALAGRGQMKVGLLSVDGSVVAAQMWLENGDALFLYYSGYAQAWGRFAVAFVATLEALRNAMEERGVRRLELLAGGGQFKERWDPRRRFRHNLTVAAHPAFMRLVLALTPLRGFARRFS